MDSKITVCQAEVALNEQVAKDTWRIKLKPEGTFSWEEVIPGKFVCLAPLNADSSMARPFSIFDTSISRGTFSLLYRTVGKNTALLTTLSVGSGIKVWGPLGNNFNPDYSAFNEIWLVGGGIGIAPLNFF
jgi:dihydroorotate dehydrogenase electron transfer subunit